MVESFIAGMDGPVKVTQKFAGDRRLVHVAIATLASDRALMLAVSGKKKRQVIEDAIKQGESSSYPIGRVLADVELPVDIHWSAE